MFNNEVQLIFNLYQFLQENLFTILILVFLVLLQFGCGSSTDGLYVADAPYRHEELAVMAISDERLYTDILLEHHYGECKKKKK